MIKTTLGRTCWLLLQRDILIAYRARSDYMNPILFFVIVITLFPLAIGPNDQLLLSVGPGVIWVTALLAILLSLNNLFASDFEDGSLEQMLLSGYPLTALVITKILAHWLICCVPLIVLSPLLCLFFHLPTATILTMLLSLLLSTPLLSLIGAIGAALTLGLRNGSILLSLLILPLSVPVLIFGTSAVLLSTQGLPVLGQLSLLAGLLVLALTLAPFAIAGALRCNIG